MIVVLVLLGACRNQPEPGPAIEPGSLTAERPALDTATAFWADPAPGFLPDQRIGVIEFADNEWCLTIRNDSIQPGAPLLILAADSAELEMWPARVTNLREQPCSQPGTDRGFLDDPDGRSYGIQIAHNLHDGVFIGVLAPLPRPTLRDFRFQVDLDGDGERERFDQCISYEGIHFRVSKSGSGPLWERYYALPYDTEPTCPELKSGGVAAAR